MKSMNVFAFLALFLAMSCTKDQFEPIALSDDFQALEYRSNGEDAITYCGDTTQVDLIAGQNILAGKVTIGNDGDSLYVTIVTDAPWLLQQTHLHVATRLSGIPVNKQGVPVPGRFAYKTAHSPAVDSFTYAIALNWAAGQELFIALHAEAVQLDDDNLVVAEETAWGGDTPGAGPRWWFYLAYTIQECEDDNTGNGECYEEETAWADGERYENQGSWATYTPYVAGSTVTLYAGQTLEAGTVSFSGLDVDGTITITITLANGWSFQPVSENLKIQDYAFAPSGNPGIGNFDYKFTANTAVYEAVVPANNFYGVHLDVQALVDCD